MMLRRPTFRRFAMGPLLGAALATLTLAGPLPAGARGTVAAQPDTGLPIASSLEGNYLAGRLAGSIADYRASADYFASALLDAPDDKFLLERALSLYIAAGELTEVRTFAERLSAIDADSPIAALTIGLDDFQAGRWTDAIASFQHARSGPLLTLAVEILSAWAEQGAGKTDDALARLGKLDGEKWYLFFRHYHAGLIASVAGRGEVAAEEFKAALAIDDGPVSVIDAATRTFARNGDYDAAKATIDKALASAPGHPLLKEVAAIINAKSRPAARVRTVGEGASEILSGLGTAVVREDTNDFGVIFLQLALALDPNDDMTRITLAENFERLNRPNDAIAILDKVSARSPLRRNADIMIAFDYNTLDKVDEARATLRRVIRKDPKDKEALNGLGNILRTRKMFAEAADVYTRTIRAIGSQPQTEDWQVFYNRGITYERTNRWPEAEADFKKALELKPDQPLVLNYLGYSWIDKGMNLKDGMALIEKAVSLSPTDGYIVDSLGWAHYKLGEYDEAVSQLERAVSLMPSDPTINDHLGDAYWQVGRRIEARFQWNHAKASKPEPEDLAKIEAKLEHGLAEEGTGKAAAETVDTKPAQATP
ncbi:TPR repeat [uncultured Pleomorphomonas sp.]|uniref:TPR repeat n=2 Tax=uncultured Pleomorphomonas sp. TaxID=442121 RepID=A0A212L841_9HYPH|nr:TPR repeat [uncultured Pleomorphomonas sp.]